MRHRIQFPVQDLTVLQRWAVQPEIKGKDVFPTEILYPGMGLPEPLAAFAVRASSGLALQSRRLAVYGLVIAC